MSKIGVFGHFLGIRSLKVSNFLHDGRGQWGASIECGAVFGKNLNLGIKGDQLSKIVFFGHFLGNQSLKFSNFLHDGRWQYKASFECSTIFGKNLNPGIKGD